MDTYYLYADEGLIGEYTADGTNSKAYTWQPNGIWGTNPVTQIEGGTTYYYLNDHLGMPQRLTDEQGNVVWSATYDAFGKATVTGTITNNLRFPGQYFDEETGLHYNWNRYYEPETGRYVSVDPIGFAAGDQNLYRYSGNNVLNIADPNGEFWWVPVIGALSGGVANAWSNYDAYHSGKIDGGKYWGSVAYGAIFGGFSAIMPGYGSAILVGAGTSGVNSFLNQKIVCENAPIDMEKLKLEVIAGGGGGGTAKMLASAGIGAIVRNSSPALRAGKLLTEKASSIAEGFLGFWFQQATNIVDGWNRGR